MDRMVVSSDHCSNPVPPSIINRDDSDMSEDDEEILSDLACYVCETVCESKAKLNSHVQLHTVVECEDCHKFIGKGTITGHIRKCKDLPRKVHSCDQCNYETVWPKCLQEHKKRVHEEGGYPCNICRKVFDSQDTLLRHKEVHSGGDFSCPDCDKTFKHLKTKDRHHRLHHNMIRSDFGFMILEQGQVTTTAKKSGFDCTAEGCDKHFRNRRDLDRHIARYHVVKVSSSSRRKTYECDSCPHVCYDSSNFRRHLQSHHLQHIVTVI